MVELSRARRAGLEPQKSSSSKSQISSKKEPVANIHIPSSPPQIPNTGAASNSPLLNKVDVDTPTVEKK